MRRRRVVVVCIAAVAVVVLSVSLAKTGMDLDQARIERGDLQSEVDALARQLARMNGQRQELLGQLDEHVRSIEQLKHEMERLRSRSLQTVVAVPQSEAVARTRSSD